MSTTTILIISNLIGAIALTFWVISIQINKKTILMKLQLLANVLYAIQYFLIGATTAAIMNLVSTVRYYIYDKNEEKGKQNSYAMLIAFIVIILVIGIVTYNGIISVIPVTISIAYTYATWQKDVKVIRYTVMFAAVVWIFYNAYVGAYITIAGNVMEIISSSIAILKFDTSKKIKIHIDN